MDAGFSEAELAFQEEVQRFFTEKYPQDIITKVKNRQKLTKEEQITSQKALHAQGWAGVNWPAEYGGTGWTPTQQYIFHIERARARAPWVVPFGLHMVGPVIYTYGSDAQKQRFLPDILASNVWWCQGYSEPGAGSDLASLKTRADRDGDEFVVNGTKTWTTLGQHADWIFVLVRTSQDTARRQEGISFLLIDMTTPGITVNPIITLDGEREVNEVVLDNVRVPVENLVGEEGMGWTYGKVLLEHERTGIAGVAVSKVRLEELYEIVRAPIEGGVPLIDDDMFRRKLARVEIDLLALEFTDLRTLATVSSGRAPGPESSILKIRGTEIQQAIDELYLEAAGYYALPFIPEQFHDTAPEDRIGGLLFADTAPVYFNNRKATIYGGSNEIQRNIIAKRVLGL